MGCSQPKVETVFEAGTPKQITVRLRKTPITLDNKKDIQELIDELESITKNLKLAKDQINQEEPKKYEVNSFPLPL